MSQFLQMFLNDWRPWMEILLFFIIIYSILHYLRNTHGALVMFGFLMVLAVVWGVAAILDLKVISSALKTFYGSLWLFLLIIFQPELRRGLTHLGSFAILENRRRREVIGELASAVQNMAKRKCGALIVIECKMRLQTLIDDAVVLDAKVNRLLIESMFFPNSPLHDGAVIIRDDKIVASRAILPLTRAENVSKQLGTRHRAAQGISEESDAVTIVVSEESGSICIAHAGKLHRDLSISELYKMLDTLVVKKDMTELSETVAQINEEAEAGQGNGENSSRGEFDNE